MLIFRKCWVGEPSSGVCARCSRMPISWKYVDATKTRRCRTSGISRRTSASERYGKITKPKFPDAKSRQDGVTVLRQHKATQRRLKVELPYPMQLSDRRLSCVSYRTACGRPLWTDWITDQGRGQARCGVPRPGKKKSDRRTRTEARLCGISFVVGRWKSHVSGPSRGGLHARKT